MASARDLFDLLGDRTVRLAVTGLSRAGKTVFITSAIHNLLSAAANPAVLPFLRVQAKGRLVGAKIVSEAAIAKRHFPYGDLMRQMAQDPPRWPDSTTGTSQIRLALRYRPLGLVGQTLGALPTLNLDIVDYPGEWLLDLPLLRQDYAGWSRETLALMESEPRRALAGDWLGFIGAHSADGPADEAAARRAGELYRGFLLRCRERGLSLLQPGRLVSPGEFEGVPVLWFCPLPLDGEPRKGTLGGLMRDRFEGYKKHVVERFYRGHFRRFDRQIVLVDVLHALNTGPAAFDDAQRALAAVLESFRFGRAPGWLKPLLGSRIDKALFAATKSDHVTPSQYGNLHRLLERMVVGAALDIKFRGGAVGFKILASVRCTELGTGHVAGRRVGMLRGVPVGDTEPVVLYPGEVPAAPPTAEEWATAPPEYPEFRPPRIEPAPVAGIPHIGLDDALEFLIGDKFW
jgi:uncharacterized protein